MARSLSTFAATALFTLLALSSAALADAPSDDDVEARLLYQAGVSAYDAGRFEDALERFQRAYELSGREMLLYNIATAAERARQDELALSAYERFLEADPETRLRGRVETVIARLRRELAQAESARETQISKQDIDQNTETQSDEPSPLVSFDESAAASSSRGPGGLITLAAGGAVLVAGAVTLGMGLADRARVQNPNEDALDWQRDAARAYDRGPALLTTGIIALPVGAALTAVGVILTLRSASSSAGDDPEAARADLSFGPGSIMLKGRF